MPFWQLLRYDTELPLTAAAAVAASAAESSCTSGYYGGP